MRPYLRRPWRYDGAPPYAALVAFDRKMKVPELASRLRRTERQVWRWKAWIREHPTETAYELSQLEDSEITQINKLLQAD